ncbi:MAG: glycosyltransferase family 4 protein, partial [Thermoprotei archaeon]
KIAFFQFFPPTIWTPGGGEKQLRKTKEALEKLGVQVELFDIWNPKRDYDIIHVFGSTYQLSDFVVTAKRLGMKVVVSPIIYTDKPYWQWKVWRVIDSLLPVPTVYTYRKRIYESADILIAGSKAEVIQLSKNFKIPPTKFRIVYNGADRRFAEASPEPFIKKYGLKDFVLQVSRISNKKGQIRLIWALENQGLELVFIGQMDPDDPDYFKQFLKECETRPWVHYLGPIYDQDLLASAYSASKVHVLPSFGESAGLVNLEAGLAGTNIVSVKNLPIYEYLGDEAFYCDPRSISSIRKAVLEAYNVPRNERLKERLLANFTWDVIAQQILSIYKEVLKT